MNKVIAFIQYNITEYADKNYCNIIKHAML